MRRGWYRVNGTFLPPRFIAESFVHINYQCQFCDSPHSYMRLYSSSAYIPSISSEACAFCFKVMVMFQQLGSTAPTTHQLKALGVLLL